MKIHVAEITPVFKSDSFSLQGRKITSPNQPSETVSTPIATGEFLCAQLLFYKFKLPRSFKNPLPLERLASHNMMYNALHKWYAHFIHGQQIVKIH